MHRVLLAFKEPQYWRSRFWQQRHRLNVARGNDFYIIHTRVFALLPIRTISTAFWRFACSRKHINAVLGGFSADLSGRVFAETYRL